MLAGRKGKFKMPNENEPEGLDEDRVKELELWANKQFWILTDEQARDAIGMGLDDKVSIMHSYDSFLYFREQFLKKRAEGGPDWKKNLIGTIWEGEDADHILKCPSTDLELAVVNDCLVDMYREAYSRLKRDEKYIEIGKAVATALPHVLQPDEDVYPDGKYGCLKAINGFEHAVCNARSYDLKDTKQACEVIRFLCAKKAYSEEDAISTRKLYQHILQMCGSVADSWRPAHCFRGRLRQLYKDAIGRNAKGFYWVNP